MISLLCSFVERDWRVHRAAGFGLYFVSHAGSILFTLLTFFYVGKLVPAAQSAAASAYGTDYFSFVLVGLAFTGLLSVGMGGLAGALTLERGQGTLEAILASPVSAPQLALGLTAYPLVLSLVDIGLYLGAGALFFGVDLGGANVLSLLALVLVTALAFTGVGIFIAASQLGFRRSGFLGWVAGPALRFLGGVYFPISVLPTWAGDLCRLTPVVPATTALRKAVLQGASIVDLQTELLELTLFAAVLLPLGLLWFSRVLHRIRERGVTSLSRTE